MKKSQKEIQKEISKERILNVSSRLFKKQGFAVTGVDQLMHEAGMTAGGFYAHFESKMDLFEQSLDHMFQQSRQLLLKDLEQLEGEKKIEAILQRYCSQGHRDFPEKGCVLPALASEIHRGTEKSAEIVANYIQKWASALQVNLSDEFDSEKKMEIALQIISRSVGAILLSRMVAGTELSDQLLKSAQKLK